jgi:molybdate transport system substrate-binding protein
VAGSRWLEADSFLAVLLRTILILLLAWPAVSPPTEGPILVSAAISLSDALQEIATAYERAGHPPVRFNFAGSNVLARQIVNGAPADLFLSADELQMDYAQQRGAIDASTRIDLLRNQLAVVVPTGGRARVTDPRSLLALSRIAVADPAAVPAGVYARQFLTSAGLWRDIEPKLLPLANVRAALVAAESGGVDAAIVYESDAAASKRVTLAFRVIGAHAPRIVYPAAIISRSKQKAAAATFLSFLRSATARVIFEKYRFIPVDR